MADPIIVKGGLQPVSFSAPSNKASDIKVTNSVISILEMEDVLFHHDSAVMMPGKPIGKSAQDGTQDDAASPKDQTTGEQQELATGLDVVALVFAESEVHPERCLLVAGHTDTSGGYALNYKLAEQRAKNVLFILLGSDPLSKEPKEEGEDWAQICQVRHKIEDYQQILAHFSSRGDLSPLCNPNGITNAWNAATKAACDAFFDECCTVNADTLKTQVQADSQHKWPLEAWIAVYKLYNKQLLKTLNVTAAQLQAKREVLATKFSAERQYVACGESYPIENDQQNNYRSQKNRRVEVLFVEKELLATVNCPAATNRKHRTRLDSPPIECPIWHQFIQRIYIDPNDIYSEKYFLQFKYFNRILEQMENVPEGLSINAYRNDGTQFPTVTTYTDGTYCVKVQFPAAGQNPPRNDWHFTFTAPDLWVFTADVSTPPVLQARPLAEVLALPLAERYCYYDLPAEWSSRNYWTRYNGDMNTGERFDMVINTIKNLVPAGAERLSSGDPLMFSLDDVVLLDTANGTQAIEDENHLIPAAAVPLSNRSRLKIFEVDATTGNFKLYQTGADAISCRIPFQSNLLTFVPETMKNFRVVYFRNGFYTIGHRRTAVSQPGWAEKGFVIGARMAMKNDSVYHVVAELYTAVQEYRSTGDFELHYFHHLYLEGDTPVSFVVPHTSLSFMADSRDSNPALVPTDAEVQSMMNEGTYYCMEHWNRKRYYFEEKNAIIGSTVLRLFYFFDEKETFTVTPPVGGFNIDFDDRANHVALFSHAAIATAQQNAVGGRSRFLTLVCPDEDPVSNWGPAYQWAIRNEGAQHYSLFKLNKSAGADQPNQFPGVPVTEHGDSFGALTYAHELGHAVGLPDEYINNTYLPDPTFALSFPDFNQFYIAYSMLENGTSMMNSNGAPRLHHCWYYLHLINDLLSVAPMNAMLGGKEFVIRLDRNANWTYRFHRHLDVDSATEYQKPRDVTNPMRNDNQHQLSANPLKRINLAVYDTAGDESSHRYFHWNQVNPYQAVLVIRVLLQIEFIGADWTPVRRRDRIQEFNSTWENWREHYRLINGNRDIDRIYVHFLAGYTDDPAAVNVNYRVQLQWSNHPAGGPDIPNAAGTVTWFRDVTGDQLVRYMLDTADVLGSNGALAGPCAWVNAQLGAAYTVEYFA